MDVMAGALTVQVSNMATLAKTGTRQSMTAHISASSRRQNRDAGNNGCRHIVPSQSIPLIRKAVFAVIGGGVGMGANLMLSHKGSFIGGSSGGGGGGGGGRGGGDGGMGSGSGPEHFQSGSTWASPLYEDEGKKENGGTIVEATEDQEVEEMKNKNRKHALAILKQIRALLNSHGHHLPGVITGRLQAASEAFLSAAPVDFPMQKAGMVASSLLAALLACRDAIGRIGCHMRHKIVSEWSSTSLQPNFASISGGMGAGRHLFDIALTMDQVSRSINGVPVYTVCNSNNEFVLVSDLDGNKSLGLFCFRKQDAEALLAQVRDRDPSLGRGARVAEVSLDKVCRLQTEGIAFRFVPDARQVKFAIEERSRIGDKSNGFSGVPVFQSDNLILKIRNQRLCPVFFRKEDLDNALVKALVQQRISKSSLGASPSIQVGSFEDVLARMKTSSSDSGWLDVVFIPPGMDAREYMDKAITANSSKGSVVS